MNGKLRFEDVKALFSSFDGTLILNMLSFQNLDNLGRFYDHILDQFEKIGENAFLHEQLAWLKKNDEEIETILQTEKETYYERCCKCLKDELWKIAFQEISKDDFKEFKKRVKLELRALVEHVGPSHEFYMKYKKSAEKTDRPISEEFMDFLRINCGIPFKVTIINKNYKVEYVDEIDELVVGVTTEKTVDLLSTN